MSFLFGPRLPNEQNCILVIFFQVVTKTVCLLWKVKCITQRREMKFAFDHYFDALLFPFQLSISRWKSEKILFFVNENWWKTHIYFIEKFTIIISNTHVIISNSFIDKQFEIETKISFCIHSLTILEISYWT